MCNSLICSILEVHRPHSLHRSATVKAPTNRPNAHSPVERRLTVLSLAKLSTHCKMKGSRSFCSAKVSAVPCMLKYNMESETFLLGMTKVKPSPNKKETKTKKEKHPNTNRGERGGYPDHK